MHPGDESGDILQFFAGLHGTLSVTFEEGTCAAWLYDLLKPHVAKLVVCNPRKNALLKDGNKSDRIDARKLAELLRGNQLKPVYHGETGVRMLRELARSYLTIAYLAFPRIETTKTTPEMQVFDGELMASFVPRLRNLPGLNGAGTPITYWNSRLRDPNRREWRLSELIRVAMAATGVVKGCRFGSLSAKSTRRNPRLGVPDICYVTYRNNKLRG
jgi:hypothetical protein